MMKHHIRSIITQAELMTIMSIDPEGHNSGAFHPGIESGHIDKNLGEKTLERKILDAPELDPHRYKLDSYRYELDPDRLTHQELGRGDELVSHRYGIYYFGTSYMKLLRG
eukprot:443525_1